MDFLVPAAFALAALAIPIILLYMLRLRRREVKISSTMLWQQVLRDRQANAPWQRLRLNALMLLQLLILLALVVALARPVITVPVLVSGSVTVLLDASASMNAQDVTPSRYEAARAEVGEILGNLGEGYTMSLINVGPSPEVLAPATDDRVELRQALAGAQPTAGNANWDAALTLAIAGGRGFEDYRIVIVSDGGLPDDLPTIPEGTLLYRPIGEEQQNIAITALAMRDQPGEGGPQLFSRITNFGTQEAGVIYTLYVNGEIYEASRYDIPPNQSVNVVGEDLPQEVQVVRATLTRPAGSQIPDYLPADDEAWATYEAGGARRVLLMTPGNRFLQQALVSQPDIRAFSFPVQAGLPEDDPFDLYVFDGWLPPQLPDGDILIVNPPGEPGSAYGPLPFTVEGVSENAQITGIVADHPIMEYVNFEGFNLWKYKSIGGTSEWARALVKAVDGPLLLVGEYQGRQIAMMPFAVQDSDLPLQISWPILMSNLLEWFRPGRSFSAPEGLAPGEPLTIRTASLNERLRSESGNPDAQIDTVRVRLPSGMVASHQIPGGQDEFVFIQSQQAGLYRVQLLANGAIYEDANFAVNLFSPMESDLTPKQTLSIGQATFAEAGREDEGLQDLWPPVVLLAILVLLIEWTLYYQGLRLPWRDLLDKVLNLPLLRRR